ncbi:MAG: hypothetical protein AB7P20_23995 [Rhizobiaceae bacterium]
MPLNKEKIVSLLGRVDNTTIAEIAEIGATPQDLREASWLNRDEALMREGWPLPGPRSHP